jgi:hypothetical protein
MLKTGGLVTTSGIGQTAGAAAVVQNGTYSLVVVNNGSPNVSLPTLTQTLISSGSTFTVSDF